MRRVKPTKAQLRKTFNARVMELKRAGIITNKELARQSIAIEFRQHARTLLDDSLRLRDAAITMDADDPARDAVKDMAAQLASEGAEQLAFTYTAR